MSIIERGAVCSTARPPGLQERSAFAFPEHSTSPLSGHGMPSLQALSHLCHRGAPQEHMSSDEVGELLLYQSRGTVGGMGENVLVLSPQTSMCDDDWGAC